MPHFIVDCSENIIKQKAPSEIMQAVFDVAEATGLFMVTDIKVRIRPYQHFKLGGAQKDFIHIFGNIMEGRSSEQKATLSRKMIERLNEMFPNVSILSINIREFEKATYCNKALIHPLNTTADRHFDPENSTFKVFSYNPDGTLAERGASIVATKGELINSLKMVFDKWEELLAQMTEEEITAQPDSGKWSVSEVISHLRAWQQISIARLHAALRNTDPDLPGWLGGADPFYAEDHVDTFNARIHELNRSQSWPTRYREWKEGFSQFLELTEALPDSIVFDEKRHSWLRGYAIAAVLKGSCEHHEHHLDSVRSSRQS